MTGETLKAARLLTENGVDVVIIGGQAVNVHGVARATEDVDLVIRHNDDDALLSTLRSINAFYIGRDIDPTTGLERTYPVSMAYLRHSNLSMLGSDVGFIDLFDYIPGHEDHCVDELFETAIEVQGLLFCSLKWLRRMKAASGRPIDLQDLAALDPA